MLSRTRSSPRPSIAVVGGFIALILSLAPVLAAEPLVFAAASLKNALDVVAARYQAETGNSVAISYAGSSALARQIEQGAPADIFISANLSWMDALECKHLVRPGTRVTLLGNALVLVAPKDSALSLEIGPGMKLAEALGRHGRLAMAETEAVPAGRYGKAALSHLGVWESVAGHLVEVDNVRGALAFVARGEAPLGIVYATDAAAEPRVRVVGTFPADSHPPIRYPAAILAGSTSDEAADFFAYLGSAKAREAFQAEGFAVLGPDQPRS